MTLEDWLDCTDLWTLPPELSAYSDRKLHLLTAAFLRRAWGHLPSHHTRLAVEATEKFADGLITVNSLAWARSQAARDSDETMWVAQMSYDDYNLIDPCPCCRDEDVRLTRYECRVAKQGGILDGVLRGIEDPEWVAAGAAFSTLWYEHPQLRDRTSEAWRWEWQGLFATVREVLGEPGTPDHLNPQWLTSDVVALARGIHADRAFDRMPILADALQDAGCDDEAVLRHCREDQEHVRGCWVVDLALGFS